LKTRGEKLFFWFFGWLWLFNNPKYLGLVAAPFLLGLGIVGSAAYFLVPMVPGMADALVYYLPHFMQALSVGFFWFFAIVFGILFLGVGLILLYCFYILLCAPFYSLLVESVLKKTGRHQKGSLGFSEWLWLTLKMLRTSLLKVFLFLFISVIGFALSLVPGLQWVSFAVTAGIFAFDSMDYSFEAMGMGLRQRLRYFAKYREDFFILSFGMALTLLVPGLTFIALPGAVVGAALILKNE
tara:strand:+ start:4143 stop:4862 length:720 start_codon:yes stop_codon:yes gene_type:complete